MSNEAASSVFSGNKWMVDFSIRLDKILQHIKHLFRVIALAPGALDRMNMVMLQLNWLAL